MAVYIPWRWFEPLPEWARAPVVVGIFATFFWVTLWAFRHRRRTDGSVGSRAGALSILETFLGVSASIIVAVAVVLLLQTIGIWP